jgi:hypothetical protein
LPEQSESKDIVNRQAARRSRHNDNDGKNEPREVFI